MEKAEKKVSLGTIFAIFAKIGAFTIGGGYAMIPLIKHEIMSRDWLEDEEIDEIIVLAQSAPGIIAVNMAIYTGYKLRGFRGSIAATIGAVLPSFVMILLIGMAFESIWDNPVVKSIFQGIRPVVVALILVPMVRMAIKGNRTWWSWLLSIASLLMVTFVKVSPIWIILVLITGAVLYTLYKQKEGGR